VSKLGLTGFAVEEILSEKFGVTPEFSSLQHLTFIISLGNTRTDIECLVQALSQLIKTSPTTAILPRNQYKISSSKISISPREAFFSQRETLPLEQAYGCICAETICPYPPGIPILLPGEIITHQAGEYLQQIQSLGGFITGCSDTNLQSVQVLKT
jgi:arginine/lysine/ornithine decarboxylase